MYHWRFSGPLYKSCQPNLLVQTGPAPVTMCFQKEKSISIQRVNAYAYIAVMILMT